VRHLRLDHGLLVKIEVKETGAITQFTVGVIPMKRLSDETIENHAREFRVALGIDDQDQPNVFDALSRCKALGIVKDVAFVDDSVIPGAEAAFDPEQQIVFVSRTCELRGYRHPRTRFSIAHEFGHKDLDHSRRRNRSSASMSSAWRATSYAEDKEESEANRFAGAWLIPYHRVGNPLTASPQELARQFNVSEQVAEIRLPILQRMYRREHNIPRPLPGNVIDLLRKLEGNGPKLESLELHEKNYGRETKYEGDQCPNPMCREFTMVRSGTSLKCDLCGTRTGDD
jgi:hypothetical protein